VRRSEASAMTVVLPAPIEPVMTITLTSMQAKHRTEDHEPQNESKW
jgi:hypothetical protein